jgi:photosystem II stability/assembly factor-like uncharacterized protein
MGLVLLCAVSGFAQGGWVQISSPTTNDLTSVDFSWIPNGLAVGDARTILRTSDNGITWSIVNAGEGARLNAVAMTEDSIAVATGLDGQILYTDRYGSQWEVVQEGWMIDYHAAHQLSRNVGVVMGRNTVLQPFGSWTTNEWQSKTDFNFYVNHDGSGNEGAVMGVHFLDNALGCAVVHIWDGHGAIVKTTDGGANWTTTYWGDYPLNAITAAHEISDAMFAAGSNGTFLISTDNGDTWTAGAPAGTDIYGLSFVNSQLGWVVGNGGRIKRTTDGGVGWQDQANPAGDETLRGVRFITADIGIAVGDGGVILRTTTGGMPGNTPPGAFARVSPPDSSYLGCGEESLACIHFGWTTSQDADNDSVRYLLRVNDQHGDTLHFVTRDTVFTDSLRAFVETGDIVFHINWRVWATDGQDTVEAENGAGFFTATVPDAATPFIPHPSAFSLTCYPNPFNPTTTLAISLPQAGETTLAVYSIEGRKVLEQRFGVLTAGEHRVTFDGSNLPSGIYISRVEAGRARFSHKLVLLK